MNFRSFLLTLSICFTQFAISQHTTSHLQGIDVLEYEHHVELNDSSNQILGKSIITLNINTKKTFFLDLEELKTSGKGIEVESVKINNWTTEDSYNLSKTLHQTPCRFNQENDKLIIRLKKKTIWDSIIRIEINYSGIPADGLVIGKNKYGKRTFFGDNWPNRAHQWFPCIDHPSDKAKVEFFITGPAHYNFIANGRFISSETNSKGTLKTVHFKSKHELPTKVMVIGAAEFAIDTLKTAHDYPIQSWVYPENKKEGFYDFAMADSILHFFENKISVYPNEKLANVQSTTRFGGMENASCIFYDEHSIKGDHSCENLMAHEIAHQWFGNSASEKDWRHLWLSEGFATYLTICYVEEKYGKDRMNEMLEKDRKRIIRFHKANPRPVIDSTSNYLSLLNVNSYQKGSWFLHMLRNKIGDELFWKGIRKYYESYQFSNANTEDFKKIIEEVSKTQLDDFFDFWLKQSEHVKLDVKIKDYSLSISKLNKSRLPNDTISIKIIYSDHSSKLIQFNINSKNNDGEGIGYGGSHDIPKIKSIEIDPNCHLLYEAEVTIEKN